MAIEGMPDRKLTRADGDSADGEAKQSHELGMRSGGADPDARLRDMAPDGVVAEVIYPTFGLFIDMIPAADLQMACAQVYNDWLAETFLHRPDVFIPSAVVPGARRRVGGGRARPRRRARVQGRDDPDDAAGGHAVQPAASSIRSGRSRPTRASRCRCTPAPARCPQHERGPGGAVINYAKVGLLSAETLCYFAASGVLERFPDLRLVFVETGAGWLAYCCERMDEAFEEHEQWVKPKLDATAVGRTRSRSAT